MKTKVFLSALLVAASSSSLANTDQLSHIFDQANSSSSLVSLSVDGVSATKLNKANNTVLSSEKVNMDGVPCLTWPVCKDTNQ